MKLIYQPKGKANEYCKWAVNLYNGCSNRCEYCYNRHCQAKALLGKDEPTLKAGLRDEQEAYQLFCKEFDKCKERIMEQGGELFFNFVSDPFLDKTCELNMQCIEYVLNTSEVTVRSLTKCPTNLIGCIRSHITYIQDFKNRWKIGFTLTGKDELEPGADTNQKRIKIIEMLTVAGFQTWASIEPIISSYHAFWCIHDAYEAGCRQFKIGILSGKKPYTPESIRQFYYDVKSRFGTDCDILWKESLLSFITQQA